MPLIAGKICCHAKAFQGLGGMAAVLFARLGARAERELWRCNKSDNF